MAGDLELVVEDFVDLPSPGAALRVLVRLLIAAAAGGLIGYDRERRGKSAGVRTHMLVALGAAMAVLVAAGPGGSSADVSRVIQGLMAGIGFLGAGTIIKRQDQDEVSGLTTAAGIWLTAALGVAAGLGKEVTVILGTALALLVLSAVRWLGPWLEGDRPPPSDDRTVGA